MERAFGSEVVRKQDANEMQLLAGPLDLFGVGGSTAFLETTATTLGNTIYLPFGSAEERTARGPWNQIRWARMHHQRRPVGSGGFGYAFDYSPISRPAPATETEQPAPS
jgi:hypothetical protein